MAAPLDPRGGAAAGGTSGAPAAGGTAGAQAPTSGTGGGGAGPTPQPGAAGGGGGSSELPSGGMGGMGGAVNPPAPVFKKKNVLLIMADDMNDWAEPFGGHPQAKTPNIKKLASRGVVFKNAYSVVPVCQPSRGALLLGMRPHASNIWGNSDPPFRTVPALANRITLPQFFKSQGYRAADAGKIFHGGDPASWDAEFGGPLGARAPAVVPDHGLSFPGAHGDLLNWGPGTGDTPEQGDWLGAGYIAEQLGKAQEKPFFLAYGALRPHLPWYVPKKYFDMFPLEGIQLTDVDVKDLDDVPEEGRRFSNLEHEEFLRTSQQKNWQQGIQAYLASLAFADECVGRVLDALERGPHKDNTIVLFMGDHGWHLGEKLHWGKTTLWEESTKTPLIVYDPSIGRAGVVTEPVSLQDIYPTLVELNGLSGAPAPLAGNSIVPLLLDPQRTDLIGWALSSWAGGHETLRTERWSLIRHVSAGGFQYELYDMLADPLQRTNLAQLPAHAELLRLLSDDIDNIIKTNGPRNTRVYEK